MKIVTRTLALAGAVAAMTFALAGTAQAVETAAADGNPAPTYCHSPNMCFL